MSLRARLRRARQSHAGLLHFQCKRHFIPRNDKRVPYFKLLIAGIPLLLLLCLLLLLLIVRPKKPSKPSFSYNLLNSTYSTSLPSVGMNTSLGVNSNGAQIKISREDSSLSLSVPLSKAKMGKDKKEIVYTVPEKVIETRYQAIENGLKEEIVLNKKPGNSEFTSELNTKNLTIKLTPDNIPVFYDSKTGEYQFHFERPFAKDAKGNVTYGVKYTLRKKDLSSLSDLRDLGGTRGTVKQLLAAPLPIPQEENNIYILITTVDPDWLNDPNRAFPITIDPTVVHDETSEFATGSFDRIVNTGSPNLESYYQELSADIHTVGLWHMNNSWDDSSDNSNHGTASGATFTTDSRLGSHSGSFDGDDSISLGNPNSLKITGNQTIEMWLYPTDFSTRRNPYAKAYGGEGTITQEASGLLNYYYGTAGGNTAPYQSFNSSTPLTLNTWNHVAIVRDLSNMQLSWYINGNLTSSTSALYASATASSLNAYIGSGYVSGYAGYIDEVRISNIARSPEEIKASAQRRPYAVYTSDVIDLTSVTAWNSLSWTEVGVGASGNIELQTRVGASANPDDGSWEEWRPITSETQLASMDSDETNWSWDSLAAYMPKSKANESNIKIEGAGSMRLGVGFGQTDANTVGLWHLDETSGTGAYIKDSSGNNNHGTPTGTTVVDGFAGKARNFNGSSNYIDIPNSTVLRPANITLEAWVKPTVVNSQTRIIVNRMNGDVNGPYGVSWTFLIDTNNKFRLGLHDGTNWHDVYSTTIPVVNNWYHVAANYDGSILKIYVNGILEGISSWVGSIRYYGTRGITIGADESQAAFSPGGFFAGIIDEVKIDNVARSDEEIAEAYRAGRDHRISKSFDSAQDLSSKTKLPFYVASDRQGTFMEATIGESAYANYEPDANTVGLWHLEEQDQNASMFIKDSSSYGNNGDFDNYYGNGSDGPCNITSGTINLNTQSCVGRAYADAVNFNAGAASADDTQITLTSPPAGLAVYDEILIIDLFGGTSYGKYETNRIKAINNNTLTLFNTLTNSYDGGSVMVQRIPQYTDVSIGSGTVLTASGWDGSKGGVFSFKAKGAVTVSGTIDMNGASASGRTNGSGKGFAGGYGVGPSDQQGYQGASYLSTGGRSTSGNNGGGGGGKGHNPGVYNPDAGGGGSYGTAGARPTVKTNPCNCTYAGVTYGVNTLDSLYFGSGGGGGGSKTNNAGGGGAGGGVIYIMGNTISVSGIIRSNGGNGGAPAGTDDMSSDGGGGGSGGSILIKGNNVALGSSIITATGGTGNNSGRHSGGGNGGSGRIAVYYSTSISGASSPAAYTAQIAALSNPIQTQGKIGKGRSFNGSSDYINVGHGSSLNNLTNMTLSAWIKPASYSTSYRSGMVTRRNGSGSDGLSFNLAGNLDSGCTGKIEVMEGGSGMVCGNTVLSINNWYHVAAVLEGTNVKFFVNGQYDGGGTISWTWNSAVDVHIGDIANIANYYFNGSIDEVRIDNIARTADEIRQAYEVGARTHQITIDFKAKLDAGNLITGSSDTSFTIDSTAYGAMNKGDNLYRGDKVIVKENIDGTEYLAQATVAAINTSTGSVSTLAWDTGSTFPTGGYTANATVFKWQREYFDTSASLSTSRDAITRFTLRITDGSQGANVWLDDIKSGGAYLTSPLGSTIASSVGNRYFQYRAILSSSDAAVSPSLTSVTLDYVSNSPPNTPTLDSPGNSATGQPLTPDLKTTATDPDGDNLKYKIELCTNSAMTENCETFDQTVSSTGWDVGVGGTYPSGTQATYTIQSTLNAGQTYYWRSYAIDPAGTNTWSSPQATLYSFITNQSPAAPTVLWCEGQVNPTSVASSAPKFSAVHNDLDNDAANYYQIEVNTNSSFNGTVMWNSGKTSMENVASGNRSAEITYAGSPLSFTQITYYWRIKFWDTKDNEGAWSETQRFTTTELFTPTICLLEKNPENTQITIKWNDTNSTEDGYQIDKKTDASWSTTPYHTAPTDATSYLDTTGISSGHTYQYRVRAKLNDAYSDWCYTPAVNLDAGNFKFEGVKMEGVKIH